MKVLILLTLISSFTFANCDMSLTFDNAGIDSDMSGKLAIKLSKKLDTVLSNKGYDVVGSSHASITDLKLSVDRFSTGGYGKYNFYKVTRTQPDGAEEVFLERTGMNYGRKFRQRKHHLNELIKLVDDSIEDCE